MSDVYDLDLYRIRDLIDPSHDSLPVNAIDFKTHLKANVALDKKIFMASNGRPLRNEYYYNGILYAEIRFIFSDVNYLMTRRIEELYYIKDDNTYSPKIVIKDRSYNHADLVDGAIVVQERIDARGQIVSSMKAFLSGVLMQALSLNIQQVVATITPFWDLCQIERDHFIEFGSADWSDFLIAIDLTTTPYTYLSIPIDQNGTTVRDYMVSRLNY